MRALPIPGAVVLGLLVAMLLDMAGIESVSTHRAAAIFVAVVLGAGIAALWPALQKDETSRALVVSGGVLAGVVTFVLVHCELGWLDLGPIGAGTPTQMPLVIAPLVTLFVTVATRPRVATRGARRS